MNYIKHAFFYLAVLVSITSNASLMSPAEDSLIKTRSLEEQLIKAVEDNKVHLVESLLKQGADVNTKSFNHHAKPVFLAAFYGYAECLEKLLNYGADTSESKGLHTPQVIARAMKHQSCNALFLQKGLLPDSEELSDPTHFHCACLFGSLEMVQALVAQGAESNAVTNDRRSALHDAAMNKDTRIIPFLINKGLSVHDRTRIGSTPLHCACHYGSLEGVQALIVHGAKVNDLTYKKITALHFAAQNKDTRLIPFLINKGLWVNSQDDSGNTPLHFACQHGSLEGLQSLLDHGADCTILNNNGLTALHFGAQNKDPRIIRFLISKGFSVHAKTSSGTTPIFFACQYGSLEGVQTLIEHGADCSTVDLAVNHGSALHRAALNKDTRIIPFLINKGLSVNAHQNGFTPLHLACQSGSLEGVRALVEHGADINAAPDELSPPYAAGDSALHYAATNKRDPRIMRFLIDAGCHINVQNQQRSTPAHIVASENNEMAVHYLPVLLKNGADLQLRDCALMTPFERALTNRDERFLDCFISPALFFIKPSTFEVQTSYEWLREVLYGVLIYKYGKKLKINHSLLEQLDPYLCKEIITSDPATARYPAIILLHKLSKGAPTSLSLQWYLLLEPLEVHEAAAHYLLEKIQLIIEKLQKNPVFSPQPRPLLNSPEWKAHVKELLLKSIQKTFKECISVRASNTTLAEQDGSPPPKRRRLEPDSIP